MTTVIHRSKGLTPEIMAELEAIAAMPDDTIDLTDMPEVTDWLNWSRGKFSPPDRQYSVPNRGIRTGLWVLPFCANSRPPAAR